MSGDRHHKNREPGYVAWDGNSYEGDPPDGWYLAKDNRWWPSEQIINESNGYAEPYVSEPYNKAYLDDDEAYGQEYRYDPAFDDVAPDDPAEPTWPEPRPTPPEPSMVESTFESSAAPPPLELRIRQPNPGPATASPPPPAQLESGGNVAGPDRTVDPGRARVPSRPRTSPSPRKRSQRGRGWSVLIFAAIALARCVGGVGGDDSTETNFPPIPTTISIDGGDFSFPGSSPFIATPGETIFGPTPCPAADGSSERTTRFAEPPPMCIDLDKSYEADLITDRGTISIALDHETAPIAVNNFIVLSQYHYYDDVPFHEIVSGGWVQTGEPFGPSQSDGGPGYSIEVEPPADGDYPINSVFFTSFGGAPHASQFAFATGSTLGRLLNAENSRFGTVVSGFDTLTAIESGPLNGTEALSPAYILTIEIRELG